MEDAKPETWKKTDTRIEQEVDVNKAIAEVYDSPEFHKDLFISMFKSPIEKYQTEVFKSERAFKDNVKLRNTYRLQAWMTGIVTVILILGRVAGLALGKVTWQTGFELTLTFQAIMFMFMCYMFSRMNRQTSLSASDERKGRLIAEGLLCCHQAMLNVMDLAKFPKPEREEEAD